MTLDEFEQEFNRLLDYYPNTKGAENLAILYFGALHELTVQEFKIAIGRILKEHTGEFLPKIPVILRYAQNNDFDNQIILAKKLLQEAIRKCGNSGMVAFEDKGVHAVVDYVGWRRLCSMSEDEMSSFLNFQFNGIYKGFSERPYEVSPYYMGTYEVFGQKIPRLITYESIGISTENLKFVPLDYKPATNQSLEMKENIKKLQNKMLIGGPNGD